PVHEELERDRRAGCELQRTLQFHHERQTPRTRPGVEDEPVPAGLQADVVAGLEVVADPQHHAAAARVLAKVDPRFDLAAVGHRAGGGASERTRRLDPHSLRADLTVAQAGLELAWDVLREGLVDAVGDAHGERSVRFLDDLMHHEAAAPLPRLVVSLLLSRGVPPEQVAVMAI